jgi:hypothetical protein
MTKQFSAESRVLATEALRLSETIRPMLAGIAHEIQGAALADLVSVFIAGHHPDLREKAIKLWSEAMIALIPESEQQMLEKLGFDPWEDQR